MGRCQNILTLAYLTMIYNAIEHFWALRYQGLLKHDLTCFLLAVTLTLETIPQVSEIIQLDIFYCKVSVKLNRKWTHRTTEKCHAFLERNFPQ